ncbi:amine oxidase [Burkholderia contaminans]|uniref:flavin monoamine oxidase family protein n=1 Tax=Burkholderia cepacia complex TaxID=87882 RepID=UPI00064A659B|nr:MULTISPECIES: FAD-dependent oxidoreductase [Burkholderia cepacia complex]AKM45281.1 amine oxidase [Burkholderia contaminans]MCA8157925.1 FAD-dependent oxidoreductase [Burkholderia contaminans]MDR8032043.1 FAD-dependent oxidoreductase [Burkholderia cenocepacia]RQT01201.1 amine oxidase [Burkholderia contaminans]RQT07493.1 amine oxidase [Burkholderia contaminans]
MQTARIAIVGAGLSGLYAAFLLEQRGINDYVLLEARDVPGGRIASVSRHAAYGTATSADDIDRFDLGPTWFWPHLQPQLDRLIRDLGLQCFEQYEAGDMMIERSPDAPAVRMPGYASAPASMRVAGGMSALIDALRDRLHAPRIVTGRIVRRIRSVDVQVELESESAANGVTTWRVEHVLLAIPPRLAEEHIAFFPPLPTALARQWRNTSTWMAPHAKYVAIYDAPFWREQGLSGEARSARGPLGEIHDASMPGGSAALFGFLGIPAHIRKNVRDDVLRAQCRAQLVRLFGAKAATPVAEVIKDWAQDIFTATAADLDDNGRHAQAPAATALSGPWHRRLTGIASEWSGQFPGYVAGAIEAAHAGVQALPESGE